MTNERLLSLMWIRLKRHTPNPIAQNRMSTLFNIMLDHDEVGELVHEYESIDCDYSELMEFILWVCKSDLMAQKTVRERYRLEKVVDALHTTEYQRERAEERDREGGALAW